MVVAAGARRLPINLKPAALRRVLFLEDVAQPAALEQHTNYRTLISGKDRRNAQPTTRRCQIR